MEAVPEILQQAFSYTNLTVALVTIAGVFFALALGVRSAVNILGFKALSAPASRSARVKLGIVGAVLLATAIITSIAVTPYIEQYRKEKLYNRGDAKMIATDGEDIYVLQLDGNIVRLHEHGDSLIDDGTNTKHISSAGGQILILKDTGQVWTYSKLKELHTDRNRFELKDSGRNTKKISHAGETVYVLKNSGELWKIYPLHIKGEFGLEKYDYKKLDAPNDDKSRIDDIASAGSVLYILTRGGEIYAYLPHAPQSDPKAVPLHVSEGSKQSTSLVRLYNGGSESVNSIFADGSILYFIKTDGTVWRIKDKALKLWGGPDVVEELSASQGTVYIRTMKGEVFRFDAQNPDIRPITKAGEKNKRILSLGDRLYVIDKNRDVYLYAPITLKRSG